MTEEKIFLVKCKREEIINRPTIKFVELAKEEIERLKQLLSFAKVAKSNIKRINKIIEFDKALLKKLDEIGSDKK
jgi:hypothetical protein